MGKNKIKEYVYFVKSGVNEFEGLKKYIATGSLETQEIINFEMVDYYSRPKRANMEFKENDLIFAKMKNTEKIFLIDEESSKNIYSTGFLGLRIIDINRVIPKFLFYWLKSPQFQNEKNKYCKGTTQEAINVDDVKNFKFLPPSIDEQKEIITYLDNKISKINEIIKKNKELIDLIEEKKKSLINYVITNGLNYDVEMKCNDFPWLKKTPEHWNINKIKHTSYVKGRIGWQGLTSDEYSNKGAYLITGTDFYNGKILWDSCYHVDYERYEQDPNIKIKKDDLLITKDGTIGKVAYIDNIPDKSTLNSGIFLIRPITGEYLNKFLYWVLISDVFKSFFDYMKTGSTIAHLYQETFENFYFPIPPLKEQEEIVIYLNKHISNLNDIIKSINKEIKLLEEYTESLIYNRVTGKLM